MNKNPIQSSIWMAERAILLIIAVATIGATIIELIRIIDVMTVNLSDLFLLFIYAEVFATKLPKPFLLLEILYLFSFQSRNFMKTEIF